MTEAEMLICTRCGKPVRMNPFNGYSLCPFCIAKNDHTVKDDVWCADKPISS
jgi:NMD protein affecting ribosome stability and mRNA decay